MTHSLLLVILCVYKTCQLNIWGFSREIVPLDGDEWSHPSFRRGNPSALSSISRKHEDATSNDDRQSDVRRDDEQLQSPGLDVRMKNSDPAAHAHMSETNEQNIDAKLILRETMDKGLINNGRLVEGTGYLAAGLSYARPRQTRTDVRPIHHLSVARAANTYCPNQSHDRQQPTVANLNASYEEGVTWSRSAPEPWSASHLKPVAGKEYSCLLNDGMSMDDRVSLGRKRSESSMNEHCLEREIEQHDETHMTLSQLNFIDSLQTESVMSGEASQKEARDRARAKSPQLPGQSNLKRSKSLPVTTISACRSPASHSCHAAQSSQTHLERRPTYAPTASFPAVDSDDYLSFLHHMMDMVDASECHSADNRTEEPDEGAESSER